MVLTTGQIRIVSSQMHTMTRLLDPASQATVEQIASCVDEYVHPLKRAGVPVKPLQDIHRFVNGYHRANTLKKSVGGERALRGAVLNMMRSASYLPLDSEPPDSFLDRLNTLADPHTPPPAATIMVNGVRVYVGHAVSFAGDDGSEEFEWQHDAPPSFGGYSCVSRVAHKRTGEQFAIKEYADWPLTEILIHMLPELRFQCGPACEGLVPVLRGGIDEYTRCYLIMPYIDQEKKMSPHYNLTQILNLIVCVAKLHDKGIVLGDLSFANILKAKDSNRVFVADIGEAMLADEAPDYPVNTGNISYVPPERMTTIRMVPRIRKNCQLSARGDVYSLGLIVLQMVAGFLIRPPATTPSLASLSHNDDVATHVLFDVIKKSLALNPDNRYPNARAMHDAALAVIMAAGVANRDVSG
ncbi:MAG: hypothetical protein HQM16_13300 [Deltaproteobacteria bacterium]|nr:hypothetical protein [Deltaproteobacteria bacterium]